MAITKKIPDTIYAANSFCPGCGHGIVIRLIGEVLDEMGNVPFILGADCTVPSDIGMERFQWVREALETQR